MEGKMFFDVLDVAHTGALTLESIKTCYVMAGDKNPAESAKDALKDFGKKDDETINAEEFHFKMNIISVPNKLMILSFFLYGDSSKDGKLDLSEFARLVSGIKGYDAPVDEKLSKDFAEMDKDKDGYVTLAEMMGFFASMK